MKRFFIIPILFSTILLSSTITIAIAANLSYVMVPLKKAFNKMHPNINVRVIRGSSGKLTSQIRHLAPYDIFLSANIEYPQKLYEENLTLFKPMVYASGALAIFSNKEQKIDHNLAFLTHDTIEKIAIANPKTAPYGVASKQALKNAKLYDMLENKLVYGESISQTIIYATSIADAGIISKSSLYAPQMLHYKEGVQWVDVDTALYTPIKQAMVIAKHTQYKKEAKAFYDFMLSSKAIKILKKFGYKVL